MRTYLHNLVRAIHDVLLLPALAGKRGDGSLAVFGWLILSIRAPRRLLLPISDIIPRPARQHPHLEPC